MNQHPADHIRIRIPERAVRSDFTQRTTLHGFGAKLVPLRVVTVETMPRRRSYGRPRGCLSARLHPSGNRQRTRDASPSNGAVTRGLPSRQPRRRPCSGPDTDPESRHRRLSRWDRADVMGSWSRYPDLSPATRGCRGRQPWSTAPLLGGGVRSAGLFPDVWSRAEQASALAAELAARMVSNFYDPQWNQLRTEPRESGPLS